MNLKTIIPEKICFVVTIFFILNSIWIILGFDFSACSIREDYFGSSYIQCESQIVSGILNAFSYLAIPLIVLSIPLAFLSFMGGNILNGIAMLCLFALSGINLLGVTNFFLFYLPHRAKAKNVAN